MSTPNDELITRYTKLIKQRDSSETDESLCIYGEHDELLVHTHSDSPFPMDSLPHYIKALSAYHTQFMRTIVLYHGRQKETHQLRASFLDVKSGQILAATMKGGDVDWTTPSLKDIRMFEK